ncbi:hypothetical protein [Phaeocystidibacter luteus]|uniref:Uncharacterized protein n=1 Tax=Phaeocystidibacter luteus TaxID=911197 RepID=A0A6N6RKT9_9FLAO|nr:hypothetical protein [Phaeocystidibacter luteus]KAB2813889.1 hypothetical protein F8C67_04175 [Phaeocystidibacter luteus]
MPGILKLKHWQLFSIIYGGPFIVSTGVVVFMLGKIFAAVQQIEPGTPDEQKFQQIFGVYADVMPYFIIPILFSAVLIYWRQKVVDYASKTLKEAYKYPKGLFRVALWAPFLLAILVFLWMPGFFRELSEFVTEVESNSIQGEELPPSFVFKFLGTWILLAPISLVLSIGQLWTYLETARAIRSIEVGRRVSAGEVVGEFFLNWFFFIGVWILQPKINKFDVTEKDPYLKEMV